jgi:hypothetical protein
MPASGLEVSVRLAVSRCPLCVLNSTGRRILSETGGIRPPSRNRSVLSLTLAEREEISRGVVTNRSIRSIAESLGRAPSTISREISRNGGKQHHREVHQLLVLLDRKHRVGRVYSKAIFSFVPGPYELLKGPASDDSMGTVGEVQDILPDSLEGKETILQRHTLCVLNE